MWLLSLRLKRKGFYWRIYAARFRAFTLEEVKRFNFLCGPTMVANVRWRMQWYFPSSECDVRQEWVLVVMKLFAFGDAINASHQLSQFVIESNGESHYARSFYW